MLKKLLLLVWCWVLPMTRPTTKTKVQREKGVETEPCFEPILRKSSYLCTDRMWLSYYRAESRKTKQKEEDKEKEKSEKGDAVDSRRDVTKKKATSSRV